MLIIYILCLVAIVFFMLILPQQKRKKKLRENIAAMKQGVEVLTIGGFRGTVSEIKENTVILASYSGAELEFEKAAIAKVMTANEK